MITVMFSTHNGGEDLKRTLDSFVRQQAPVGGWRLIAVDNASTDGSGDVMRGYADRLPITVLHEPMAGKNRALNSALEVADGDFYIFTDDDVIFSDDYLVQWRTVADSQPDFELFAGCTLPLYADAPPPQSLMAGADAAVLYATHEGIGEEGPCDAALMWGTNMAARPAAFASGVRFSTTIGPDGTANYAMGSDSELALRLQNQGLKCWFTAGPTVKHIVPAAHLEPAWILRRGYRWGRGLARMHLPFHCLPDVLARKNTIKALVYPVLLPFLPHDNRWRRQWQFMVDRGYEDGTRDERGQKPRWS